jgi:hypothetical protein
MNKNVKRKKTWKIQIFRKAVSKLKFRWGKPLHMRILNREVEKARERKGDRTIRVEEKPWRKRGFVTKNSV